MDRMTNIRREPMRIVERYMTAKETVTEKGFASEIDWQDEIQFSQVTESDMLREAAWVVLSSGMRETVIREKFPYISAAFHSWQSAKCITASSEQCRSRALAVFCHKRKINAIITIAKRICEQGFEEFKKCIHEEGIEFIQTLPYMGPATSYHLAKNIGLDVVKPDRHLLRVAAAAGYDNPALLCEDIAALVGDRVSVVDLVIWRFATLNPDYAKHFA